MIPNCSTRARTIARHAHVPSMQLQTSLTCWYAKKFSQKLARSVPQQEHGQLRFLRLWHALQQQQMRVRQLRFIDGLHNAEWPWSYSSPLSDCLNIRLPVLCLGPANQAPSLKWISSSWSIWDTYTRGQELPILNYWQLLAGCNPLLNLHSAALHTNTQHCVHESWILS